MGSAAELCDTPFMVLGACLCGWVRYEAEGPFQHFTHCHCSMCRKHHGAPFATLVEVGGHAFRWIDGERSVMRYPSSAGRDRRFCERCGSVAPTPLSARVLLPAGNLLGEWGAGGDLRGLHRFVGSKAPWHVIADSLPQHDAAAPGWAPEVAPAAVPPAAVAAAAVPPAAAPPPTLLAIEGVTIGSCLCGGVTFSVSGAPRRWLQCHCSRCRRGRSAAHGSNAFYPLAQFAWHSGRDLVRSYRPPDAERFTLSFCGRCGGGAPVQADKAPFVLVPAGLFDGDPGTRPQAHIHMASKAPWSVVRDGLPQYAELPAL